MKKDNGLNSLKKSLDKKGIKYRSNVSADGANEIIIVEGKTYSTIGVSKLIKDYYVSFLKTSGDGWATSTVVVKSASSVVDLLENN